MEYKIGQILTSNQDAEIEKAISGEKVIIPKGNKVIIGPDKFAHHLRNCYIQPLAAGSEVKGYDTEGLAEYIFMGLNNYFPLNDCLDEYDLTKEDITNEIAYLLDDIGF